MQSLRNKVPQVVDGCHLVDHRGVLTAFNKLDLRGVRRQYIVRNHETTVRAWHGHWKEQRWVQVLVGSVLVGAVDMKNEHIFTFVLSDKNPQVLHIPKGYANGWKNLTQDAIVMYMSDKDFNENPVDDPRFPSNYWNVFFK